jgi:hypothetical protein
MNEVEAAIRYIFVLSFILIIVAYWAGSTQILSTGGKTLVSILQTSTGRDVNGKFASYPSNAPAM